MSPKELLYIDDALGHEQFLIAQCQEAEAALIEVAVTAQAPVLAGGQGQRRAARAGGKAEIAQAEAPQLFDD